MESELQTLQLEVKGALYELNVEQLLKICSVLIHGLGKEQLTGKNRGQLIALITSHVERPELAELEDEGMSELLSIKDLIENIKMPEFESTGQGEDKERQDLQKEVNDLRNRLHEKEEAMQQITKKLTLQSTLMQKQASAPQNNPVWRKDFKIAGQIGEPGQKDKLTFSSLARQIESGFSKGYQEDEIIDAVIRAITPGLQLRSYLEGKSDLTLPVLRRILRSHYQERGATELYKQLSSEVQSSKETSQNFLLRAMDLRQKILFASQEAESGLKYDPVLVQSLFMHTILTGLQSDNIKNDMQPYLLQTATSDEVLLEKVIDCQH